MIRVFIVTALLAWPSSAAAQRVALSFDDGFNPDTEPKAAAWNANILDALSAFDLEAIYFVTGNRVDTAEGLALVQDWGEAGHLIANHSYEHMNLGSPRVSLVDFIADVEKNEALLSDMPGWTQRFRFPFLKEGETAEKRDGFRAWLSDNEYVSGAVSIDASDWYYNMRFLKWTEENPEEDVDAYRTAYLEHLLDRATYYDSLANEVLGRSVDHVLLLHTNAINAHFTADIIKMFRSNGWEIIGPDEAYQDPVYRTEPDTLPAGESIIWALAKQKGIEGLRYPA